MFATLHELAKKATLMITVAAEGDGQLRVNITPMPFDSKAKSNLPQPLSLLATPAEFDADFATALSTWHVPKRSLIQQAQDATEAAPAAPAPALPAPKSEAKGDKPGRKSRASKTAESEQKTDVVVADDAAAGEAAPGVTHEVLDVAESNEDVRAAAGAVESIATAPAGATDEAAVEAIEAAAGGSAPEGDAKVDAETAGDAQTAAGEGAAAAPSVGEEPVDKFTLDLF